VANHIHFTEIRKIRAAGQEALFKGGNFHVPQGKGKPFSSGPAFFPKKRLLKDKPCST
jgi:hypothetical protein